MSKLDRLGWAVCDWFEIDGYRFGVRTTSPAFGDWTRYALGGYLVEGPADPDDDPLFSLVVEDETSQSGRLGRRLHIFYYGTADLVRTLDARTVARSFLSAVEALTLPGRDDALYLEASVISGNGMTVLIPSRLAPAITAVGRRIQSAAEVALPAHLSVAIDLVTGHLIPVPRSLDIPWDSLDVLGRYLAPGLGTSAHAFVDEELPIDRVVVSSFGHGPALEPTPRGPVLLQFARSIRNLSTIGGAGLTALGRALSKPEVLTGTFSDNRQLVQVVGAAVEGGRYVSDRTQLTPRGSGEDEFVSVDSSSPEGDPV